MTYGQGSLRVDRYEPGRPAEPACTTSSSTPACPPGRTLWRGRDLAGATQKAVAPAVSAITVDRIRNLIIVSFFPMES